jgi:hypothetical protein
MLMPKREAGHAATAEREGAQLGFLRVSKAGISFALDDFGTDLIGSDAVLASNCISGRLSRKRSSLKVAEGRAPVLAERVPRVCGQPRGAACHGAARDPPTAESESCSYLVDVSRPRTLRVQLTSPGTKVIALAASGSSTCTTSQAHSPHLFP